MSYVVTFKIRLVQQSVKFCTPDPKTCAVNQKAQIEPDNCMVLTPT